VSGAYHVGAYGGAGQAPGYQLGRYTRLLVPRRRLPDNRFGIGQQPLLHVGWPIQPRLGNGRADLRVRMPNRAARGCP